ncbi:MAG: hypothetical protein K8T25_01635 [Planctomycetia bacterium]|nr:hypothetical protein [Planctomycetia bacterium]
MTALMAGSCAVIGAQLGYPKAGLVTGAVIVILGNVVLAIFSAQLQL